MIFLKKVFEFFHEYENHSCANKDNARLYGLHNITPPIAEHVVFAPMSDCMKQDLIRDYKLAIPAELLKIYGAMNGADLFWSVRIVGEKNTRIPFSRFSIYGVPWTYDRQHIEPFNIRIEDLSRPKNTPGTWLKFGSYYRSQDGTNRLELFVDTETGKVSAVEHECEDCCVFETWESMDSCLSNIFDSLNNT